MKTFEFKTLFRAQPWLELLELLHVFVGSQANFPRIYETLKETSMHQNFTDSI